MRERAGKALLMAFGLGVLLYTAVSGTMTVRLTHADRLPLEDSPATHGLPYEDVSFPSRSGDITLRGWRIAATGSGPAIIFVHGVDVNREADRALELAEYLVRAGFDLLLFDLRAHGRSDGERVSAGHHERLDLLGAVDYLRRGRDSGGRIGVLGNSMGAAIALLAAADEPAIAAVVADSPYADLIEMIPPEAALETGLPAWFVRPFLPGIRLAARLLYRIDLAALAPVEAAARLEIPVLLIHGTGDTRVAHRQSQRIRAHCAHPASSLWLPIGAGHVASFAAQPEEYARRVVEFFDHHLRRGNLRQRGDLPLSPRPPEDRGDEG